MPPKRSKSTCRKSKRPSKKASHSTKNQMESHMPPSVLFPFLTLGESADFAMTSRRNFNASRPHVNKLGTQKNVQNGLACYTKFDQLTEGLQTYCQNNAKDALAQMLMMFFGPLSIPYAGVSLRTTEAQFYGDKTVVTIFRFRYGDTSNVHIWVGDKESIVELKSSDAFEITTFLLNNAIFQEMILGKWTADLALDTSKDDESETVVSSGYFPVNLGKIEYIGAGDYGLKFKFTPIIQPTMHFALENVD